MEIFLMCVCSVSLYINIIKLLVYLVIIHYKLPVKFCFKTLFVFEHVTLKYMRYCSNWLSHIFLPCVYLTSTIIFHPSSYTCGRFESQFVVVQSLNHVWLFAAWTAAFQASLSFTISQSLLKLLSTEAMTPFNYFIFCHPPLLLPSVLPSIRVFSNESAFALDGWSIGASASTSVLPVNIQVCHCFQFSPSLPWSDGTGAMILVFWMLSFKSAFSLFFFPSSLRGSLVPLHFLILGFFHLHIWDYWYCLIPVCDSSSLAFHMMYFT